MSPTGDYSVRKQERACGFSILVHAEIEAFLEDRTREIFHKFCRDFNRDRKVSYSLSCFLCCYHSSWIEIDERHNSEIIAMAKNRGQANSVADVIQKASIQFSQIISNNHGVKEKNLRSLLIPIGVDFDSLDSIWIAEMESFGALRGERAHTSASVTRTINPEDELYVVRRLLIGLQTLDEKINQLT
ncbi:HEPN domain-containing protein [Roseibacillus persicicus]|uniref:HEPN domain-containing protein n=1 Tax=Roseibacillus persicicus TaxID=454148 RepID=UPI00280F8CB3|nr:HEPN domain-containing protein [Roseibacillus persicicus]MDQ8190072.1 HEPN domain-containing protein [Roseibacillus persicicus]